MELQRFHLQGIIECLIGLRLKREKKLIEKKNIYFSYLLNSWCQFRRMISNEFLDLFQTWFYNIKPHSQRLLKGHISLHRLFRSEKNTQLLKSNK